MRKSNEQFEEKFAAFKESHGKHDWRHAQKIRAYRASKAQTIGDKILEMDLENAESTRATLQRIIRLANIREQGSLGELVQKSARPAQK